MEQNISSSQSLELGVLPTPEDNYIEADYRTVELCRSFMKDYENDKILYYNPFTGRRIKKGTSTFSSVYCMVKKYLKNLDEEEFHSPIKNVTLHCKHINIESLSNNKEEEFETNQDATNQDVIVNDWTEKAKANMKTLFLNQEKSQKEAEQRELYQWRNDLIMDLSANFETKRSEWININPELYSFLDTYKPEIFENKFLMNHIFLYDDHPSYFINYLQNSSKNFLNKDGYGVNRPNAEKRYSPAMVMFWIYSDFLKNARKFLKKNSKKMSDYLKSKTALVRLNSSHLNSLSIAHFLFHTPPEKLSVANDNYEKYFEDLLKTFFTWCNAESVVSKIYYMCNFCDFMGSRIKPYRFINFHYDDISRFKEIIEYVSNPITVHDEENSDNET